MHFNRKIYITVFIIIIISACEREAGRAGTEAPEPRSSRLSELLGDGGLAGYPMADRPREFSFPRDHGPHPAYRNEWWYFTGNLDSADGERFGYELTIFRFALAPGAPVHADSAWSTSQVYIGHLAVTDVARNEFHVGQRYSRGAAGLAGAESMPLRVWLDNWRIEQADDSPAFRLRASDQSIALSLALEPVKAAVLNGEKGLSQKSAGAGSASYYYSIPRLDTRGTLDVNGRRFEVSGLSWLDREWGSSALSASQAGWDWFALQFADGSELMFYTLRKLDGSPDPHSAGTWVNPDGSASALRLDEVEIRATGSWKSEHGGSYPSGWQIRIPAKALDIRVRPVLENQELVTTVRYWEGAVDVAGAMGGAELTGRGYVELTGYSGN